MIGRLDPEENVLGDKLTFYGARKSREILYNQGVVSEIASSMESLGWECYDDVVVEIGGRSVSGIDVGEDYNPKWSSPKGTVKNNKDAFIVIKNRTRTPFTPSQSNET